MRKARRAEALPWTGERLVTTCRRPLVYEHLHRYALAFALAKRKRVLDIACGEGYGANLLSRVAAQAIGVDRDASVIAHAKAKYRRHNLRFVRGSCTDIPCEDHSQDLVASFETIEHIAEHDRFLSEIKRVLTADGILVISSPHKTEYQKLSETANPFHEAELDHDEFVKLIKKAFKYHVAARQRLVVGSWMAPDAPSAKTSTATFRGGFDGVEIESGVYRGVYSIAICSDRALPECKFGVFENLRDSADIWSLLDVYDTPAQLLDRINDLTQQTRQVARFKGEAKERAKHVAILQRENEEKTRQVFYFKHDAEERAKQVALLQRENEEKISQVAHLRREAEEGLMRARSELLDARWEALMLRRSMLRNLDSADMPSSSVRELETRAETLASECDQLRTMLTALQSDIEHERESGQAKQNELRTMQDQFDTMTSERDQLRTMLTALQSDIEREREAGQAKQNELRTTQVLLNAT